MSYLNVSLGPCGVWRTGGLGDNSDKDEESDGENSLLVDDLYTSVSFLFSFRRLPKNPTITHVDFRRDGSGGKSGTENETTSLGPKRAGWDGVDDRGSLLIRGRFYQSAFALCVVRKPSRVAMDRALNHQHYIIQQ